MLESFLHLRWLAVWYRNWRVWRKLWVTSLLANFAEPLMTLVGLGYGLGFFVGTVHNQPYIVFLAAGIICGSAMNTATFEGLYSAYTRLAVQHTWQGMWVTPLEIEDIVLGESVWAATKSLLNVTAILIVATSLGLVTSWQALWVVPLLLGIGGCFATMALVITALATSYDFFLYYLILVISPLTLLSGVYFPLEKLPEVVQKVALLFPLAHAVQLTRPLMTGQPLPTTWWLSIGIIILYSTVALHLAVKLVRRRLSA